MFKKIIDAIVAFFKGPQVAPVVVEEAPVVTELSAVMVAPWAAEIPVAAVPVVEEPKKPRKPRAPKAKVVPVVKKPAAKKAPAKKTTKPKA